MNELELMFFMLRFLFENIIHSNCKARPSVTWNFYTFWSKKKIMPPLLQTLIIELLKSIWSLINDEKSVKILVESLIKTWGVHLNEAAGLQLVILLKNMNSFKDVVKEFCGIFDFQGTLIPRNTSVDHFWRV